MKIEKLGTRGVLFTFKDDDSPMSYPTMVYVINACRYVFVCDTHLGPKSMEPVKKYIAYNYPDKKIIVFNSHSDYDHSWGNCAFKDSIIISHTLCRRELLDKGRFILEDNAHLKNGGVFIRLPDLTFDSRLIFEEEQIEFFYTPGHTADSSSCIDKFDNIIFSGDLIEFPIPYLSYHRLDKYLDSLNLLTDMHPELLISAHSGIVDDSLIKSNIDYINKIKNEETISFEDEYSTSLHSLNMKTLLISRYEEMARDKFGNRFNAGDLYKFSRKYLGSEYKEFQMRLDEYLEGKIRNC